MPDIPVWVVGLGIALAIGFAPLIVEQAKKFLSKENTPTPVPVPEPTVVTDNVVVSQTITKVFNAEDADELALLHAIQLFQAAKYDLAKQAFDLAISQKNGGQE